MKIGVIGGGSVGLLFAFYLSEQFNVTIYTNTVEQAEILKRDGIYLLLNGKENRLSVNSMSFEKWTGHEDLTIVAVKQYHLNVLVPELIKKQTMNTDYLFLQNGMGHIKLLSLLKTETIYVSSVEHGAFKSSSNSVQHNGIGQTKIALYKGTTNLPSSIFTIRHFPIVMVHDYFEMLINKLIANVIINPLTALLKVSNGEIIKNEHYFKVVKHLFSEVANILNLENQDRYFRQVIDICEKTATNRSSMLKDLDANKPTEVDAILGYILDEAEMKKMEAPICQMLYHFIKGSEK